MMYNQFKTQRTRSNIEDNKTSVSLRVLCGEIEILKNYSKASGTPL